VSALSSASADIIFLEADIIASAQGAADELALIWS